MSTHPSIQVPRALAAAIAGVLLAGGVQAAVITFNTYGVTFPATATSPEIPGRGVGRGAAVSGWGWNYSGDPTAAQRPVYSTSTSFVDHLVCIGPAGNCASNDNDGVAGNEYAGYEFIHFNFSLPVDAINVEVHFGRQLADDRHVLLANGHRIGGFKSGYPTGVLAPMLSAGGSELVEFSGTLGDITLSDPALFHAGDNALTFWLNNTFSSSPASTARPHAGGGDPSALQAFGWIQYDIRDFDVPEPPMLALVIVAGVAGAAAAARRRRD